MYPDLLAAGFDDYLSKPVDAGKLEEMMIRYLPKEKVVMTEVRSGDGAEVAEEESLHELPDWLGSVAELEVESGLAHCGDVESYLETLTIYAKNAPDSVDEIAKLWGEKDLDNNTVKVHASNLYHKLGVTNRVEAVQLMSERKNGH